MPDPTPVPDPIYSCKRCDSEEIELDRNGRHAYCGGEVEITGEAAPIPVHAPAPITEADLAAWSEAAERAETVPINLCVIATPWGEAIMDFCALARTALPRLITTLREGRALARQAEAERDRLLAKIATDEEYGNLTAMVAAYKEQRAKAEKAEAALALSRDDAGRAIHEDRCARERAAGCHGPEDTCETKYDGSNYLDVIVPCAPREPDAKMWDDDKSERSLDPYPEQFRVRCKKFHADLRPWSSLPEARREEYRAQGEAVLAEVRKRTGAGS